MRCVITTTPGPLGIVYIYGDYSDDGDTRTDLTRGMTQRHPPSRRKGRRGWMSRSNTGAAPVKGRGCVCVWMCVCVETWLGRIAQNIGALASRPLRGESGRSLLGARAFPLRYAAAIARRTARA